MTKRTKALDISKAIKDAVWERDGGCCVICGSHYAMPNAHYISRAHGGLGIEQNVVTLCQHCHHDYDNGAKREENGEAIREYLSGYYADWDESHLVYRKWCC